MQKIISLVLILTTIFFMTGCGSSEELDIPGIELVGNIVMEIEQYSEFVDPGATILGDFNIDVVIDSDVDTSTLGDYTITYTITYESIEYVVSRTVRVVEEFSGDTRGLIFVVDTTIVIEQYSDFLDPGVEIIGEFGLDVVVDSNVDVNTIGTYEIVYTISYMEIDYNLTRYVEVVEADTGDSLVLTEDYYSLSEDYFGIEFLYDDTGFSSIHMWAEIYKDGVYIDTDVIYDYTYFDFYDLDPETDYVVNVYANYTTTSDFVEHYRTEVMVYEITTDAAPIVPVVENIIITRTSDSITVEFDLIDSGDIMKSAYLYIVRGWSNAAIAEVFVGHNLITFNEYIDENTFYEIVISANYTFNDDPAIYEGEVYTPPVITVDSFTGTKMFFGNDNVIMKLELDNYEKVTINAVTINGITYDSFKFPSNNIDTLYIDMGVYTDLGTHPMNLSEIIITLGEEEYKIEVNVSAEVPVYLAGSIVPEEATVGVLEIVPDKYHVNISFDDRTEISTVGVSVYLDNPFELPVSSITIGGVTYSGSDLNVISFTQVRFTAEFSFDDSPSNNSLYFNSISFTKNGDVVNSTNSGTGDVTVSIRKVYDTDTSDEFPIIVLISTPGDLMDMEDSAARPGTVFRLTNDIDMTGYAFIPFGTSADSFGAMFDGNGYTISNVTINKTLSVDSDYNYIGFFGNAISFVTNLTLDNINITVSTTEDNTVYVGILAGK